MAMHNGTPLPPAIQAMMQQGQAKIQQLEQAIATKQPELQVEMAKAQLDADTKLKIAAMNNQTAAATTEAKINGQTADAIIRAETEKFARMLDEHMTLVKAHTDIVQTAAKMQADSHQRAHDAAHDVALSALEHGQAKDLADQAHSQTMAQAQQAADLAPPPTAQADGAGV